MTMKDINIVTTNQSVSLQELLLYFAGSPLQSPAGENCYEVYGVVCEKK